MGSIQRPARILVGVFPKESQIRSTIRGLETKGISRDFIGAIIRGENGHGNLLSVLLPRGQQEDIRSFFLRGGATAVGEPGELEPLYGIIPHPGIMEDYDLKLPVGREYPETLSPPALSWPRIPLRTLSPRERVKHFGEIELGYDWQEALEEANRCVLCPQPLCVQGCPVHNDIPGFIRALLDQDIERGIKVLRKTTNFPGICGRVCNKARQCEGSCLLLQEGGEPVAIGSLERFLADEELMEGWRNRQIEDRMPATGKRVAIVGSGPSGLAAAGDLALRGHRVTVYEALPVIGGALAWGIPPFRLPKKTLDAEVDYLSALGIEFKLNTKIGKDLTVDYLLAQGCDAIFVGVGATVSTITGVAGEDLQGIYSSTEFLSRVKLAKTNMVPGYDLPEIGEKLAVIGAGNTAMDVAQTALRLGIEEPAADIASEVTTDIAETALRLGVEEVTLIYRRSEAEMPARREEVESAREEGVHFRFLTSPTRFLGDQRGHVVAMECVEMGLGAPDATGRRRPLPKPGSEFIMEVDTVVLALGYKTDPTIVQGASGIKSGKENFIIVEGETGRTSRRGIWSGGDIVTGPDTVVKAMRAGKRAARDIDQYLQGIVRW